MSRDEEIKELEENLFEQTSLCSLDAKEAAEYVIIHSYRKASEVVFEVIGEIEEGVKAAISALQFENNPIHRKVKHEAYSSLMRFIKTIKKKHTESEKDNE